MDEALIDRPVVFACRGEQLLGIVCEPPQPGPRGVLIVVGGPQYRVGSHRQFVLLARALANGGVATMRFDYRGMGDSSGELRDFEDVGEDIAAAIDRFIAEVPAVREVVLWGLCDGASASLFHAHRDPRVTGVVLLNPWVRTQAGEAKAYLRYYYVRRLLQKEFWQKILRGKLKVADSMRSLLANVNKARASVPAAAPELDPNQPLPQRMGSALQRFGGKVLLILSGQDLTAQEFMAMAADSGLWRSLLADVRVLRKDVADANHTFSRRAWRDDVARSTLDWMRSW